MLVFSSIKIQLLAVAGASKQPASGSAQRLPVDAKVGGDVAGGGELLDVWMLGDELLVALPGAFVAQ